MADRREICRGCGVQLVVPPEARSIRCAVCRAITRVRPSNPFGRVQEPVRQAAGWLKGLINNVSSNINSNAASLSNYSSSIVPFQGNYPPGSQPPGYPSVHGKKRALLCGVSYKFKRYELKGTVNDVNCMRYFLVEKMGFPKEAILVLTEEETGAFRTPTKQNIRMALHWLVHDCKAGDSLVFHYSGHGSRQPDFNRDEVDGYDETLCPLDYETEGMILDDEINDTIVRPLPRGATLHAIIDACHSGTVLDLPFLCRLDRDGYFRWENQSLPSGEYKGTSGGLALSFSSCDDHQTSVDTFALSGSVMTGAMTYSFIQAVENEPAGLTYGRLLNVIRLAIREAKTGLCLNGPVASLVNRVFRTRLSQEPQLSSSELFDIYKKPFIM